MTAFTVTTAQNIDELSGKTGGDTYAINGGTLTIDQDSRVGTNQSTSASIASATISATLGGTLRIDARKVRLIPFNTGTGNVPAWNTLITQGGASGKLIGVHSSLTAASTATGAAMPASGYLRVKQWNDVAYAAGALTGIGASATGADTVGWIEVVGDEGGTGTINANRLGVVEILGEFLQIGTTNGTSNQTMQIPNNGLLRYVGGVYIETAVGAGTYAFWPNAGTTTSTGTDADRGKCVWIDANGLCRIGNSGAATNGYTPVTGLKVMVGNVFLENCATATRTANVIPNSTPASRFDFTTTGGGVVTMEKVSSAWYLSFAQAYSVTLTDVATIDAILVSELATALTWTRVGVGNKPTTALSTPALTLSLCFAGGTFTDCVWNRVTHGSSGHYTVSYTDIAGFTFVNDTMRCSTIRSNAGSGSATITRAVNCTWTTPRILQGQFILTTCTNITVTDTVYVDCISSTNVTTYATQVWTLATNCNGITISGLTLPVANTRPYTCLLQINAAGCSNVKLRNIGTRASPLSLASTNGTGLIFALATGAAATDVKIQRVYCSTTRTGIMTGDNSSSRVTLENVYGDYADAADVGAVLNYKRRGLGTTLALTAQTSVYGTHWADYFTSTTAGRIAILMNEPTALTTSEAVVENGAAFTSAGGLYMPVIGHKVTFTTPDWIKGHTSFQNSALIMAGGGAATNFGYRYQIDKGAGWSAWSATLTPTTLGTTLNGETGIDAQAGFKLKLEITTSTTNSAAITSVYMLTNSSTTAQDYQYALENPTFAVTGLQAGSEVRLFKTSDSSLLGGVENSGTDESFTYPWDADISAYLVVLALGYQNQRIPVTLTSAGLTVPVQQVLDRQYLNP